MENSNNPYYRSAYAPIMVAFKSIMQKNTPKTVAFKATSYIISTPILGDYSICTISHFNKKRTRRKRTQTG